MQDERQLWELRQWERLSKGITLEDIARDRGVSAREIIRILIIWRRIGDLMQTRGVPAGMTFAEGVDGGYIAVEQIKALEHVTDSEIEATLAHIRPETQS